MSKNYIKFLLVSLSVMILPINNNNVKAMENNNIQSIENNHTVVQSNMVDGLIESVVETSKVFSHIHEFYLKKIELYNATNIISSNKEYEIQELENNFNIPWLKKHFVKIYCVDNWYIERQNFNNDYSISEFLADCKKDYKLNDLSIIESIRNCYYNTKGIKKEEYIALLNNLLYYYTRDIINKINSECQATEYTKSTHNYFDVDTNRHVNKVVIGRIDFITALMTMFKHNNCENLSITQFVTNCIANGVKNSYIQCNNEDISTNEYKAQLLQEFQEYKAITFNIINDLIPLLSNDFAYNTNKLINS